MNLNITSASRIGIYTLFATILFVATACDKNAVKDTFSSIETGTISPLGIECSYPSDKTIFPPEFPPPLFEWTNVGVASYSVFLSNGNGKVIHTATCNNNEWRPDEVVWENLKTEKLPEVYFSVIAMKKGVKNPLAARIQFSFSSDSVNAGIFFRAVTLPFSYAVKNVHTIEWYMGNVDGSQPRKMLDNLPVCGNCHSFSTETPLLAMDVDYGNDKGSYVITETVDTSMLAPEKIITWSDYKREDNEPTFGLLSQISPDGNHVLSTVKDLSIFAAVDDNMAYSQLFFPIKGIVGVYDRRKKEFSELEGANDPGLVQSNPTWSPDGQKVVFARTEAYINEKVQKAGRALLSIDDVEEFASGDKEFKYDLYTVDFNDGKGGVAMPLQGASENGKSNYFPKFSPDGKWIVFCQAENFMLLQPDSRLYIMPAGGGEPRLMNCNMNEMNSWHSWSPNGRWLVFSSKNRSLYTQLYLTHIDENGMDSPPVLLENLSFDKRAANIPEFYPFDAEKFQLIKDNFSKTAEYFNRGAFDKMSNQYYLSAYTEINKAIGIDSTYLESYFNRIMINQILKQSNSLQDRRDKQLAMELINNALADEPDNVDYLALKVSLYSLTGRPVNALETADRALTLDPDNYKLFDLKAAVYRNMQEHEKAMDCYRKMIQLQPQNEMPLKLLMVNAYVAMKQNNNAKQLVDQCLLAQPSNREFKLAKAQLLLQMRQLEEAKKMLDILLLENPLNVSIHEMMAQFYRQTGNRELYFAEKERVTGLLVDSKNNNKENIDNLFQLAGIYQSSKNWQEAESIYNEILAQLPFNYEALHQKAKIKLNNQQWHEAIAIYDQLEKYYPLEEGFCNNKAIAFIQTGNHKMALRYFNMTLEINPNNKDAKYNRDRLRKELGVAQ